MTQVAVALMGLAIVATLAATMCAAGADVPDTAYRLSETFAMDFPAGRCGGHAETGVRWRAPAAGQIRVSGGVWKLQANDAAYFSLWVCGRRVVSHRQVPPQSGACNSRTPLPFDRAVREEGRDAGALGALTVQTGDEVIVQVEGNDFVGIDLTVVGLGEQWSLAGDFSDEANPHGVWCYGRVTVDGTGRPTVAPYARRTPGFASDTFCPARSRGAGRGSPGTSA